MTLLSRIKLNDFRNLESVELDLVPGFNLFFGANGSGKTSLLEAIYVLSAGRSFRTSRLEPLVREAADNFVIYAETIQGRDVLNRIGLKRLRLPGSAPLLRLNEQTLSSWALVASCLPVQLINTDSFSILEGGGKARRRFMDWALFHVEPSYLSIWRLYRRAVTQRNALLKQKVSGSVSMLDAWDVEVSTLGNKIHEYRQSLIQKFIPILEETVRRFLPDTNIDFEYKRGWSDDAELLSTLKVSRQRDLRYGITLNGPHRADFALKISRVLVTDMLSRGQTKMLIFALKLAMGEVIKSYANNAAGDLLKSPVYLIDDLAAELDEENCNKVIQYLYESTDQCLFTAITQRALSSVDDLVAASGKFHVEHGKIFTSPATV